jgi:hypothetical protein
MPGDASIEAWATVAAAAFTLIAVLVAGLAARKSYELLDKQTKAGEKQTELTAQLAAIEVERAKREQEAHEAAYVPSLTLTYQAQTPKLIEGDPRYYEVTLFVHNEGPAAAKTLMYVAANVEGLPIDRGFVPYVVEPRTDGMFVCKLPPEMVEGKYHAEAHYVDFTVVDTETYVKDWQRILIPAVDPPPGKGGPFDG